jgi:hypothetical protein
VLVWPHRADPVPEEAPSAQKRAPRIGDRRGS